MELDKENTYSNTDSILTKVKNLLHHSERCNLILLMGLSLITAFVQSIGIASFMPFLNLVMNLNSIHENVYLNWVYSTFHFQNEMQFVIYAGIAVGLLILISNGFAILNNVMKHRFVLSCTHKLSRRLLKHFLYKPYEFILQKNSSELTKSVLSDVNEFSSSFLNSLIELTINTLMMIFILAMLLIVDVKVTISIIGFFVIIYGSLTYFTKNRLKKNGQRVMDANRDKHKYAYEAITGFKISKALGIEDYFLDRYTQSSKKAARYQFLSKAISEIPKNVVEAIVFCGLAASIVIIIIQQKDFTTIIPTMSVYIIAGYRIMPEIARIFSSITNIVHHQPVVDRLYGEFIIDGQNEYSLLNQWQNNDALEIIFNQVISLKDIVFKYENSEIIIDHLSLSITKGSVVGFAGTTGAGKTTLIDIIMGLHRPQSGGLYIDDKLVNPQNVRTWRAIIGYVPQDIFLIDDTIRANIAFGISSKDIDDEKIRKVAQIAAISDFIEQELPENYHSMIGDRGVRLSGGQRQRIGLARALYRDPEVLVLDEATSALDGATEESVVKSIHSQSKVKTIIIIAHRLNTLKPCDNIYLLEHGQIIDQGSYGYLAENNIKFRQMAKIDSV